MSWLITADDRTGALEVAGMCLRPAANALVSAQRDPPPAGVRDDDVLVVDLATRHLEPEAAGRRTARFRAPAATRRGHKIDSLLRGNWAVEIGALAGLGHRIVVVPAFPAMGRTCVGGVVRARGTPVDQLVDGRRAASTARPVDSLRVTSVSVDSGVDSVRAAEIDRHDLGRWLGTGGRVAVCDAESDDDLAAIAAVLGAHPDVTVVGTSAVLAACAGGDPPHPPRPLPTPALVVCGSAHPTARSQLDALAGLQEVAVLATDLRRFGDGALGELAAAARGLLDGLRTLVVIGGDTAAAVLGPGEITVSGTVVAGMPWCARVFDRDLQLVTKAGAFGDRRGVLDLFLRR